jgi:hypothetical protein
MCESQLPREALNRPLQIDQFQDGASYEFAGDINFGHTGNFLRVAEVDEVFIKVPSDQGAAYLYNYLFNRASPSNAIRRPEGLELRDHFEEALSEFPAIRESYGRSIRTYGDHAGLKLQAFWLILHNLHYLKIKEIVKVPRAKFVDLKIGEKDSCAIVQERVSGTRLWDIYDYPNQTIRSEWGPFLGIISEQLAQAACTDNMIYFDFNLMNFIFDKERLELYYVDSKPSWYNAKSTNDHNLIGIERFFLVGRQKEAFRSRKSASCGR